MKKILAWILLAAAVLSLFGCGSSAPAQASAPTEAAALQADMTEGGSLSQAAADASAEAAATEASDPTQPATAQTLPAAESPTEEATVPSTEAAGDKRLFLKVSAIDFSLVGDSEDIYLGLVPREEVTWESDDPTVISVENGVLTAVGVGSTTIRATYGDQQLTCTAGCLAKDKKALGKLSAKVLSAPKRLPPEVDLTQPCTYFDKSCIVGDSITQFMMQHEGKTNYLGKMVFMCRGGVSMNGFVLRFKNIYYRGKEMHLEDAIAKSKVERAYFLMGSNDLSSKTQRPKLKENWAILLDRIRDKHPTVEIVLISNIPEYREDMSAEKKNKRIEEYNLWLKEFAEENGCLYLDLAYYVQDHYNRMPRMYKQGNYHMNEAGCVNWMKILRFYAQYESEGGTLS